MVDKFVMWRKKLLAFARANGGNVAMMFGLSIVPITIAAGGGIDFARAMMVRSAMADALDAANLAVGATPGISAANAKTLAQQYVTANYSGNASQYGAPVVSSVTIDNAAQTVTIVVKDAMPTTFLSVGNVMPVINLSVSSTVTWGGSKLWVALVLDNTGSMTQTDSTGTSKLSALKTASENLITTLQNASTNVGDVQMTLTPFAKLVNIGTGYVNSTAIDWTDWLAQPPSGAPSNNVGPGDSCPWSNSSNGYTCVKQPASTSTVSTIPSSGTYSGYICPSVVNTNTASGSLAGKGGHYYNGCYTSSTVTSNPSSCNGYTHCSCTTGRNAKCTATTYTHAWKTNSTSTWGGCVQDRNRKGDQTATVDYDTMNTSPGVSSSAAGFSAANDDNCPATEVVPLPSTWSASQWTTLTNDVKGMTAQGSTNQTIGLAHGWQTLTNSGPYDAPTLPVNTSQVIILVSDGLNTQDRWYGDGSNQSGPASVTASVDYRMSLACTNAKAAGITIYAIFVDLGGTQGNSSVLQACATDDKHYFDLQTSGAIITTFATIAQQITNLRVSQ